MDTAKRRGKLKQLLLSRVTCFSTTLDELADSVEALFPTARRQGVKERRKGGILGTKFADERIAKADRRTGEQLGEYDKWLIDSNIIGNSFRERLMNLLQGCAAQTIEARKWKAEAEYQRKQADVAIEKWKEARR